MAGRETADIVFCMDASASMRPAFVGVCKHVTDLLDALKGDLQRKWDVRFDFLAYSMHDARDGSGGLVEMSQSVYNQGSCIPALYGRSENGNGRFFTSDVEEFRKALGQIKCQGDESTAFSLDMAADFPFRDSASCHRVIILLTDEKLETGHPGMPCPEAKLMALVQKLLDRRILLYMVTPQSIGFDTLAQVDKCEWTIIQNRDGSGLGNVDFSKLLQAIGKSISTSQTVAGSDRIVPKPLFGQETWTAYTGGVSDADS